MFEVRLLYACKTFFQEFIQVLMVGFPQIGKNSYIIMANSSDFSSFRTVESHSSSLQPIVVSLDFIYD